MGQGQFRGEFVCFALRRGFKSRAYTKLSKAWPLHKNRTPGWGVITQWERHTVQAVACLCLCKNRMTLPKSSTRDLVVKVSDELKNAKSRHVR